MPWTPVVEDATSLQAFGAPKLRYSFYQPPPGKQLSATERAANADEYHRYNLDIKFLRELRLALDRQKRYAEYSVAADASDVDKPAQVLWGHQTAKLMASLDVDLKSLDMIGPAIDVYHPSQSMRVGATSFLGRPLGNLFEELPEVN
ncbi:MAG: hypothetical protein LQ343_005706 [Gyalolechia ehrenbergii]|nr:MAG: hypothetical protein LQ343_005706 [Gyalolechia ehrenbergii]